MEVFFKKEFIDLFLAKTDYSSVADCFIDKMIREYNDMSITVEGINNTENYAISSLRLRYKLGGGTRVFALSENLENIISTCNEKKLVLYFTDELVNSNLREKKNVLVFTLLDYQNKIEKLKEKLTFGIIVDSANDWQKLNIVDSSLVQENINDIIVLDPYIFADFYKSRNDEQIHRPFLYILNKIVPEEKKINLEIYTIVDKYDHKIRRTVSYGNEIKKIIDHLEDVLHPSSSLSIFDNGKSNNKSRYNFHDRNIVSNIFILKVGIGFAENFSDYTNSEVECLSIFDRWGYDLILHRNKMINSYKQKLRPRVFSR